MFTRALYRLRCSLSNLKPESKTIARMAQKIETMNEALRQTSPKIIFFVMFASTIPSFYFVDGILSTPSHQPQFLESTNASTKYISIKNIIMMAAMIGLSRLNFLSPSSKFVTEKISMKWSFLGLGLSWLTLCLPPSDSKHSVWGVFFADLATLGVEVQLANAGVVPFWLYSFRHYIRFFDWLTLIINYFALRNRAKKTKTHPHLFTS